MKLKISNNPNVQYELTERGTYRIHVKGRKLKRFYKGAAFVPIEFLETLELKDLNMLPEIAIDYSPNSKEVANYPAFSIFGELRISIFNNKEEMNNIVISVAAFTPHDVEELELGDEYQLKMAEILSRKDYVEFWSHPKRDIDEFIEATNYFNDLEKETGIQIGVSPVGITGFWIYANVDDDYKSVLEFISEFLFELDQDTRNAM